MLQPGLLSSLGLKELSLSSRTAIDVYGDVSLDVSGDLRIKTGAVRAMTEDAGIHFGGTQVTLEGVKRTQVRFPRASIPRVSCASMRRLSSWRVAT